MHLEFENGNDLWQFCSTDFEAAALAVYQYQFQYNNLYREYNLALGIQAEKVKSLLQIPFLPISFFKSHQIFTSTNKPNFQVCFESSGTTGMTPSRHFVKDIELYNAIALAGFESFYGPIEDWVIVALLPSYLERGNSSLVHMVDYFMQKSNHPDNGFYLDDFLSLSQKIKLLRKQSQKKVLLIGVTFALLDFAAAYPKEMEHVVVMETGGMKGRKEELTRNQVHDNLKYQWQLPQIHSEYGMTELLSQAYAKDNGLFSPIKTMQVLVRDVNDPLDSQLHGSGVLNIVDLANVHSCSFIATEDLGKVHPNGTFEVLGRMDFSALRGCSLLAL